VGIVLPHLRPTSHKLKMDEAEKFKQSKRWIFVINNYDETELESLRANLQKEARYAIFGKEVGKAGTPHIQGYASFRNACRFKRAKLLLGERAHLKVAKGNEEENFVYCSKQNDFEEIGSRSDPGKRNDLELFKEAVKNGDLDPKSLREKHSCVFARCPRFCIDYMNDHTAVLKPECHPLRDWQTALYNQLKFKPDDRKITFVVDEEGNEGKTWFCKYYCYLHSDAMYLRPTKHADMAFALQQNLRVLFLDCTRQQIDHLPYSFLESVKDGLVFSPKYESRMKMFSPVHVVVMMNQEPNYGFLSPDRYDIVKCKLE